MTDRRSGVKRGMTVAQLRVHLAELPDDALVEGNAVGNLLVRVGDQPLGYIDVGLDNAYYSFESEDE